jgi:hypothetical protein
MSHVYTIARGLAPALVAIGAVLLQARCRRSSGSVGIALVSLGIAAIGITPHAPVLATAWAGVTGVTIATYSILRAWRTRQRRCHRLYRRLVARHVRADHAVLRLAARFRADGRRDAGQLAPVRRAQEQRATPDSVLRYGPRRSRHWPTVTAMRETSGVFGAAIRTWVTARAGQRPTLARSARS